MRRFFVAAIAVMAGALPLQAQQHAADEAAVRAAAEAFSRSLASGDSTAVIALLHPDVVIFEGGRWESLDDYRKGHLRADMQFLKSVKQETARAQITVSGDLAVITRENNTTGTVGERTIDSIGAETLVLVRTPDGWKLRHVHWSSRPRRRPAD